MRERNDSGHMDRLWRRHSIILGVVAGLLCLLIASFGHRYATAFYLDQAAARGHNTLGLAVTALRGQLARYEKLPELIADDPDIKELVADPSNRAKVDEINVFLKQVNGLLESSDIYIMLPDGLTLAASNFDQTPTFVGENFSYRPYFYDALEGGKGRFFALGTTSAKRGYYFGAPIHTRAGIKGVVVFKVDVDVIENAWRGGDYEILVTDPEGIIFMTGRQDWLFSAIEPLTEDRLARTIATRRYADAALKELKVSRGMSGGHDLLAIAGASGTHEYLAVTEVMPTADWTVKVLLDTASARAQALTTTAALALFVGLGATAVAAWLQRRARLAERLQMQREAREQLERRVEERTADLAAVNGRLEEEVAERRATERALRKTQSDLVQAGKLAALGQMSAALSHEFNQPLAAVRTYADNAALLMERGRGEEARDAVERISRLTDRMAAISRHLRNFARKPNQRLRPVALEEVVGDTLEIIGWRLKAAKAELVADLGAGPLWVQAGSVRLQQVLVNIISNAVDAVDGLPDRHIELNAARTSGDKVTITVRDRGPGVPEAIAGRIFDPFFSTKGVGKGLGLGLSISYNIVKDFGGSLAVERHPEGGAVVIIVLDAAEAPLSEAAE